MSSQLVSKPVAIIFIIAIIALFTGLVIGKVDPLTFFIIAALMYAYIKFKTKK